MSKAHLIAYNNFIFKIPHDLIKGDLIYVKI